MRADVAPTVIAARRSGLDTGIQLLLYLLLIVTGLVMIMPFIIMLLTSFKPHTEVITFPPRFFPTEWTFENYELIWSRLPFGNLIRNSIIYSLGVSVISLIFDSMCAYALARLNFRGRNF